MVLACVFGAVNSFMGWAGVAFGFAAVAMKLAGEQDFPPSRLLLVSGLALFARLLQLQWKLTKTEEFVQRLRDNPAATPPF